MQSEDREISVDKKYDCDGATKHHHPSQGGYPCSQRSRLQRFSWSTALLYSGDLAYQSPLRPVWRQLSLTQLLIVVSKWSLPGLKVTLSPTQNLLTRNSRGSCSFLQKFALLLQQNSPLKFVMKWPYNIENMLSMCPKRQNVGQVQHFSTSAVLFAHPSTGSCCNQSTKSIIPKHPPVSSVESRSGWRGCPNAPLMLPILHSIYELENDTWQEQQNLILQVFSCLSILFVQLPAPLGD